MGRLFRQRTWLALVALVVAGGLALETGVAQLALRTTGAAGTSATAPVDLAAAQAPDGSSGSLAGQLERAAASLVSIRSAALAGHDESAWESTIADPTSDDGRQQMSAYAGLVALGVTELTATDVRADAAPPGASVDGERPSAYPVTTRIGHQIPGYDREPRVATRTLTLASTPAGWRIATDAAATDQLQVWDLPALHVVRSATTLVAGDVPESTLAERLADADAAADRLRSLFGAATPSVLVVPATAGEAARQVGHPDSSMPAQVAATTDGQSGPLGTAGADRVVLSPDAFQRLTAQGRRVVVTHELTHVATRATTTAHLPPWLSEGFAEYVAWGPVSMPVQTASAQLLAQVRTEGPPLTLPSPSDFDSARAGLATAYQAAWLAVRRIAAEHGEPGLMAFYRAVAGAPGTPAQTADEAFGTVLGTTTQAFVEGWRGELEALAR